jgi:hypothetical protein
MFNMTKSISPVCFIIDNHRALFLFTENVHISISFLLIIFFVRIFFNFLQLQNQPIVVLWYVEFVQKQFAHICTFPKLWRQTRTKQLKKGNMFFKTCLRCIFATTSGFGEPSCKIAVP